MNKNLGILFVSLMILVFSSCGGGSAGTGTTSFTGKLLTTDNKPVEGAVVTVAGTGELATTDENGEFVISTQEQSAPVQLLVQTDGINASVEIPVATSDESKVGVQLQLDRQNSTVTIRSLEIKVSIIGECENYFLQSDSSLIQVRSIPDNTKCTVRVSANSGTQPKGGVLAQVQRTVCSDSPDFEDDWISVASGRTRESGSKGRVDIKFTFFDDDAHCQYRVVAPVGDKSKPPLVFSILTFREQGKP